MELFTLNPQDYPVATAWFVLFVLLSFACPLKGQNPRGSLHGKVQDAMGARIATATVSVSNNGIAVERTTQVNGQGEFRIDDLPSGRYQVVVHAGGFDEATKAFAQAESRAGLAKPICEQYKFRRQRRLNTAHVPERLQAFRWLPVKVR